MIKNVVSVGVAGVGALGQHHARIYTELPGVRLAGVYDVDPAAAAAIAERYHAQAFSSLEELAKKVEAVSVVVPTDRHREVAGFLLEQGRHVLVEKPIAATTQEAEDLVTLAGRSGCILQVGHVERFNPVMSFLENRERVPRFIEAHRLAPYPPPRDGRPPRGTEVSVILDLMIHDLEVILHLVGAPVREIRAVGVPVLSPTEDIANVRLSFANGSVANITASRISPERMRKIRVFFDDAYISLDYQNQTGEMFQKTEKGIVPCEVPIEKGEPLALELRSFTEAVARHDEPVVTGEQASEALKLAVAIIAQAQQAPS